ncbi:Lycopene beta cyclase- chloroplastic [Striga hermonthica]|uniref:Lycopene beta cyclase- chloroplastic n=1 Tax=Striga hermonthica TaxID=68872 RepID=A0A9N7RDE6_STRHE|nr:Lycopene beta cyclase- chloroplastic [Striga hermonthica]
MVCWNCENPGHMKSECRAPRKDKEGRTANAATEDTTDALLLSVRSSLDDWIVDSGASFHSCSSRDIMEPYTAGLGRRRGGYCVETHRRIQPLLLGGRRSSWRQQRIAQHKWARCKRRRDQVRAYHFKRPLTQNPSTKYRQRVHRSTKVASFLDLKPMSKPKPLDFDLPLFNPADKTHFDVIVIGADPAGLRLAEQVSRHGINVCCIDPSPLSMWPNNYGVWVDEFETLGLGDCLDKTWPTASVVIDERNTKHLDHPYGRVSRKEMKTKFLSGCAANGTVRFHKTKAWKVEHEEFKSLVSCVDGSELRASLVVDASGCSSNFVEYDKPRNPGFQIAHGILAEVDGHPFDVDQMLLMDWRDSHLENEPEPLIATLAPRVTIALVTLFERPSACPLLAPEVFRPRAVPLNHHLCPRVAVTSSMFLLSARPSPPCLSLSPSQTTEYAASVPVNVRR